MASPSPQALAARVVDTTLQMLCAIRSEMRQGAGTDLTMAQFRALVTLHRSPGASLSDVADEVGVSPPAMSKLIDGLVERGLVERTAQANDRRRVELVASAEGRKALERVRMAVQARVAERLASLTPTQRSAIAEAMAALDAALAVPEVLA